MVREGDMISIDLHERRIDLDVDGAVLEKRKEEWA